MREAVKELLKRLNHKINLDRLKKDISKSYKLKKIPTNIEILNYLTNEERLRFKDYLITKPVRTLSGVAPVAVMTKPLVCPHVKKGVGPCSYCPGGPNSYFGNTPQSYTGKEPATMRAIRSNYDPYLQVFNRLEHYVILGQVPEKIELIVMGGTFPSFNKKYQEEFIKYCFRALNDFSRLFYNKNGFNYNKFKRFFELPCDVFSKERTKRIQNKLRKLKGKASLEKEQSRNEKARIRCIGLTIETRPDYGKLKQGNEMLRLGCTRVELGIQSVYDDVLKKIQRGHTIKDSIESIRILKDLGFKLNFHMMLGINNSRELQGLKELFINEDFKPDMLKLYPCMVLKGTRLYDDYKKGKYNPLNTKDAAEIISEFKRDMPSYCRIMRIQRDIPTSITEAGPDKTNLRQYVDKLLKEKEIRCNCIRCREIGRNIAEGKPKLKVLGYEASKGKEFFISLEDKNSLYGFCRLRFPSQFIRKEITKDSVLIRELHIYGESVELGKKGKIQHKGYGKLLLRKAEEISEKNNKNKIVVISGIGVKEYYKKLGYKKDGPYMVKYL